jgi:hypothetical protein
MFEETYVLTGDMDNSNDWKLSGMTKKTLNGYANKGACVLVTCSLKMQKKTQPHKQAVSHSLTHAHFHIASSSERT